MTDGVRIRSLPVLTANSLILLRSPLPQAFPSLDGTEPHNMKAGMIGKQKTRKRTKVVHGRWRRCTICQAMWLACVSCSARWQYCSEECSREARQRSRRSAVRRYSLSEKGKENQRSRQRKYRLSLKEKAPVTDHSQNPRPIPVRKTNRSRQKPANPSVASTCRICKRGPLFLPATSGGQLHEDPYPCPRLERFFQGYPRPHLRP